jgi:S1-C subfamily serine protease
VVGSGILVISVEAKSPAQEAGIRDGDIIVGFGDASTPDIDALHRILTDRQVGIRSTVTLLRGTEKIIVEVTPSPRL